MDTFWNHYNRSHSSFHVLCLSSRFWGGCGDQCLGSQKKVIHRNPLLVRGSHASCTSCCLLNGLCIPHLKQPTFLLLFFIQDGSRGSGSGEEGRVQPPVRHLGSRHYRHWTGRAPAAHVWPPPDEVRQRRRTCFTKHLSVNGKNRTIRSIRIPYRISEHWCWCPRAASILRGWETNPSGEFNHESICSTRLTTRTLHYHTSTYLLYRSSCFQTFVKMAVTKNPRKRPSAETLLQVSCKASLIVHREQWRLLLQPSFSPSG